MGLFRYLQDKQIIKEYEALGIILHYCKNCGKLVEPAGHFCDRNCQIAYELKKRKELEK